MRRKRRRNNGEAGDDESRWRAGYGPTLFLEQILQKGNGKTVEPKRARQLLHRSLEGSQDPWPTSNRWRPLQKECQMKGRQSGMPSEELWSSFFDFECVLGKLGCDEQCGDVLEFGCGYGHFTEAAAKRITGTVYALDIEKEMIEATRSRSAKLGLLNVQIEQRDFLANGCGRPDASIGLAMLFNILHIEEPVELLREARRVLAPGGKAGILHWNYDPTTPRGPSMDIRPRPEQCRAWAEQAGLQFTRFDPLECCRYHWGLIAERP